MRRIRIKAGDGQPDIECVLSFFSLFHDDPGNTDENDNVQGTEGG